MTTVQHSTRLTVVELAARLGTSPRKIQNWIRSGELKAINLAADPNKRPRWVIDLADLQEFEARRATL